jgi:hypothetical protein
LPIAKGHEEHKVTGDVAKLGNEDQQKMMAKSA